MIDRLAGSTNADGGWGYRPGRSSFSEPTALACLALAAHGSGPDRWAPGLAWLAEVRRRDGGVPISPEVASPCWATGLAVLAWVCTGSDTARQYDPHIKKATTWLLASRGRRLPRRPDVFAHDTTLQGWAWVEGTHSWIEPTAYAVLALRAAGKGDHPRTREGVSLLLNRAFPDGGWNYGNTRTLGNTLRPFPSTTGITLSALAGEPPDPRVEASIKYVTRELQRIRSPLTLAWGLIGLTAWNARPVEAHNWLAESALHATRRNPNPLEDALLLLADVTFCPPARMPQMRAPDMRVHKGSTSR